MSISEQQGDRSTLYVLPPKRMGRMIQPRLFWSRWPKRLSQNYVIALTA